MGKMVFGFDKMKFVEPTPESVSLSDLVIRLGDGPSYVDSYIDRNLYNILAINKDYIVIRDHNSSFSEDYENILVLKDDGKYLIGKKFLEYLARGN